MPQTQLKVLIAEDSAPDRLILESIVSQMDHIPIAVSDGAQAIQAFDTENPDIVLMDVLMPVMGGLEAAEKIRKQSLQDIVPIIFLTSLTDSESLIECLEVGGDDFIPKPYNRVVLQSKIKAFARMRELHQTLAEQKKVIEKNNRNLMQEQEVAKQVFDKITHSGSLDDGYLRYYMSPLAVFNGDVLVSEVSPTGSMVVLLGDFTGHGLPAAIGSMPLATTFYGMVRKGFSVSDIMREINQKLHEILPVGFFCCATCLDINFEYKRVRIWNGGLPESFLYRKSTDSYEMLSGNNLPLGVLPGKSFNAETQRIKLDLGDRIYMWSDGIFEARNAAGDMFGEDRLHTLMHRMKGKDSLFDKVLGYVHGHIGMSEKDDDISLVEIEVKDIKPVIKSEHTVSAGQGRLSDWKMDFTLEANSLKDFDPLPLLTNIINEVPGLRPHRTVLYTVLAELYSNALEHGVLGLKSEIKNSVEGFTEYYNQRAELLDGLKEGHVCFSIEHQANNDNPGLEGELKVRITDSGNGFDLDKEIKEEPSANETNTKTPDTLDEQKKTFYHGRGLTLMSSVCKSLIIHPPGNDVEVRFLWHKDDA